MSLRVGMVARTLNLHHIRGTGRYVQELLRNTTPSDGIDWVAYGLDPGKPLHLPTGFAGKTNVFDFRDDRFRLWEQLGLPLRAQRAGVQVLHCADNTAPVWQPMPTVVTIHDTVPWVEEMPDRLTHFYMHPVQRAAFKRCAAIITISENSRRDIEARWPEVSGWSSFRTALPMTSSVTTAPRCPPTSCAAWVGRRTSSTWADHKPVSDSTGR